jgi:hypothetical protein
MIGLNPASHLCSLSSVEMALAKGGSPASDWQQGDIDVRHLPVFKLRTCVPRIPTPPGALHEIAKRRPAMRASRKPSAVVIGG